MQKFISIFSAIALLQGCSAISREAGYPGGNVGYLADRYTLFAQGHDQQVNRYLVSLALLAPLIAETTQTSSEAKLSAERIKDLYQNIEKLEVAADRCVLKTEPKDTNFQQIKFPLGNCAKEEVGHQDGSTFNFESLSFGVNKSLNDALKQAFDNLEIRTNAKRALALEPTELLKTILKARRLVPVLIRFLSTYRDVSVVFAVSVTESCQGMAKANSDERKKNPKTPELPSNLTTACSTLDQKFNGLLNRTRNSNADIARDERPITEVFDAGKKALDAGLDWQLSEIQRIALLQQVNQSCKRLDALAKIETPDYTGCTINLTGSTSEKGTDIKSGTIDEDTQTAAEKIVKMGPATLVN